MLTEYIVCDANDYIKNFIFSFSIQSFLFSLCCRIVSFLNCSQIIWNGWPGWGSSERKWRSYSQLSVLTGQWWAGERNGRHTENAVIAHKWLYSSGTPFVQSTLVDGNFVCYILHDERLPVDSPEYYRRQDSWSTITLVYLSQNIWKMLLLIGCPWSTCWHIFRWYFRQRGCWTRRGSIWLES